VYLILCLSVASEPHPKGVKGEAGIAPVPIGRAADLVDKNPESPEAGGFSGRAAKEVRACHQSQDRKALGPGIPPMLVALVDEVIE
jgi:hypothetical protein